MGRREVKTSPGDWDDEVKHEEDRISDKDAAGVSLTLCGTILGCGTKKFVTPKSPATIGMNVGSMKNSQPIASGVTISLKLLTIFIRAKATRRCLLVNNPPIPR